MNSARNASKLDKVAATAILLLAVLVILMACVAHGPGTLAVQIYAAFIATGMTFLAGHMVFNN